mmetsp:Transcript_21300/g.51479  ORF Transcript_21300/g.51479 Transcript_21300/m.51479 type:complete len:221 (+) Transcript_21300:318-980(+)
MSRRWNAARAKAASKLPGKSLTASVKNLRASSGRFERRQASATSCLEVQTWYESESANNDGAFQAYTQSRKGEPLLSFCSSNEESMSSASLANFSAVAMEGATSFERDNLARPRRQWTFSSPATRSVPFPSSASKALRYRLSDALRNPPARVHSKSASPTSSTTRSKPDDESDIVVRPQVSSARARASRALPSTARARPTDAQNGHEGPYIPVQADRNWR